MQHSVKLFRAKQALQKTKESSSTTSTRPPEQAKFLDPGRLLREAYQSWLPAVIQLSCSKSLSLFKEPEIVPSMLNSLATIRRVHLDFGRTNNDSSNAPQYEYLKVHIAIKTHLPKFHKDPSNSPHICRMLTGYLLVSTKEELEVGTVYDSNLQVLGKKLANSPDESKVVPRTVPITEGEADITDDCIDVEEIGYPSDLDEDFSPEESSPLPFDDTFALSTLISMEYSDDLSKLIFRLSRKYYLMLRAYPFLPDLVVDSPDESKVVPRTVPVTEGEADITDDCIDVEEIDYPSDLDEDFSLEESSPLPFDDTFALSTLISMEYSDDPE
ncbi:DEAD-box ATP-dependent RNA helicase 1 [Platanthera guangdongensis]|uniref:DEAD-box ATP-dependent RNA helicase 1 n=1 Tax=Platanthera guangdongensis TaxID=2320717 RepID=A0ABR2LY13_9ASPA